MADPIATDKKIPKPAAAGVAPAQRADADEMTAAFRLHEKQTGLPADLLEKFKGKSWDQITNSMTQAERLTLVRAAQGALDIGTIWGDTAQQIRGMTGDKEALKSMGLNTLAGKIKTAYIAVNITNPLSPLHYPGMMWAYLARDEKKFAKMTPEQIAADPKLTREVLDTARNLMDSNSHNTLSAIDNLLRVKLGETTDKSLLSFLYFQKINADAAGVVSALPGMWDSIKKGKVPSIDRATAGQVWQDAGAYLVHGGPELVLGLFSGGGSKVATSVVSQGVKTTLKETAKGAFTRTVTSGLARNATEGAVRNLAQQAVQTTAVNIDGEQKQIKEFSKLELLGSAAASALLPEFMKAAPKAVAKTIGGISEGAKGFANVLIATRTTVSHGIDSLASARARALQTVSQTFDGIAAKMKSGAEALFEAMEPNGNASPRRMATQMGSVPIGGGNPRKLLSDVEAIIRNPRSGSDPTNQGSIIDIARNLIDLPGSNKYTADQISEHASLINGSRQIMRVTDDEIKAALGNLKSKNSGLSQYDQIIAAVKHAEDLKKNPASAAPPPMPTAAAPPPMPTAAAPPPMPTAAAPPPMPTAAAPPPMPTAAAPAAPAPMGKITAGHIKKEANRLMALEGSPGGDMTAEAKRRLELMREHGISQDEINLEARRIYEDHGVPGMSYENELDALDNIVETRIKAKPDPTETPGAGKTTADTGADAGKPKTAADPAGGTTTAEAPSKPSAARVFPNAKGTSGGDIEFPEYKTDKDLLKWWLRRKGTTFFPSRNKETGQWSVLWTDITKPATAMRMESRPVTAPVFKAIDSFMDQKGIIAAIKKLQDDIIEDKKTNGGAGIPTLISAFTTDNKAMLDEFKKGVLDLKDHVDKKFHAIPVTPEGSKWRQIGYAFWSREYGRYGITHEQKAALLKHLDGFVEMATDLQNPAGVNATQMTNSISKYWDPVKKAFPSITDTKGNVTTFENNPIGISRAYQMAHDSFARLTGQTFQGSKAAVEWTTNAGQSINHGFYSNGHSGQLVHHGHMTGATNFEATYQNPVLSWADPDDAQLWSTDAKIASFFSDFETLVNAGFAHKAVDYFDELLRRSQHPEKGLLQNTPMVAHFKKFMEGHVNLKPGTPLFRQDLADFYGRISELRERHTGGGLPPGATEMWDRFLPNRSLIRRWMDDSFYLRLGRDWIGGDEWDPLNLKFRVATPVRTFIWNRIKFHTIQKPLAFVSGAKEVELIEDVANGKLPQKVEIKWNTDKDGKAVPGNAQTVGRALVRFASGYTFKDSWHIDKDYIRVIPLPNLLKPSILGYGLYAGTVLSGVGLATNTPWLQSAGGTVMDYSLITTKHMLPATVGAGVGGVKGMFVGDNYFEHKPEDDTKSSAVKGGVNIVVGGLRGAKDGFVSNWSYFGDAPSSPTTPTKTDTNSGATEATKEQTKADSDAETERLRQKYGGAAAPSSTQTTTVPSTAPPSGPSAPPSVQANPKPSQGVPLPAPAPPAVVPAPAPATQKKLPEATPIAGLILRNSWDKSGLPQPTHNVEEAQQNQVLRGPAPGGVNA
jgi:hypothetical protein